MIFLGWLILALFLLALIGIMRVLWLEDGVADGTRCKTCYGKLTKEQIENRASFCCQGCWRDG